MSSEDDGDIPQLSTETLAALEEFYKERSQTCNLLNTNNTINEDWQLSQFWYDDQTVEDLVKVASTSLEPNSKIALISCPTLYKKMKEKFGHLGEVTLYEYDQRFAIYGNDFVLYDYNMPLNIPEERMNYYDLVIADPPFLSEECLMKTSSTIKCLAKNKVILCTGGVMENHVFEILDLKRTCLKPRHKNNLANEFCCYSNFNVDGLLSYEC